MGESEKETEKERESGGADFGIINDKSYDARRPHERDREPVRVRPPGTHHTLSGNCAEFNSPFLPQSSPQSEHNYSRSNVRRAWRRARAQFRRRRIKSIARRQPTDRQTAY